MLEAQLRSLQEQFEEFTKQFYVKRGGEDEENENPRRSYSEVVCGLQSRVQKLEAVPLNPPNNMNATTVGKKFTSQNKFEVLQVMQEHEERNRCLVIQGLKEVEGEDLNKAVNEILVEVGHGEIKFQHATRIGKKKNEGGRSSNIGNERSQHRPIKVSVNNREIHDALVAAGRK